MGLSHEKRKALAQLVGSDTASRIEQTISEKDASAEQEGKRFKSIDTVDIDLVNIITDALTETAEKCTPGTKDGKYRAMKAEDDMEDDDMEDDSEDDSEDDGGDFLLTRKEMEMIATTVAKKLSSEMKGMYRKKSTDTGEMESTFKEWTSDSVELSEMIVQHLEDINTRLEAFESVIGVGHTPSQSRSNVVSVKDKGLSTVEDSIMNWLSQ